MKTLDELINIFEKACDLERRCEDCSGCLGHDYGCPNDGADAVPDALHYLKELRHILDNTVWVESTKEEKGYWKLPTLPETGNDPLTWDELKQMEGKPVWIEGSFITEGPHWIIVGPSHLYNGKIIGYGKTWQAYRKER